MRIYSFCIRGAKLQLVAPLPPSPRITMPSSSSYLTALQQLRRYLYYGRDAAHCITAICTFTNAHVIVMNQEQKRK